MRPYKFPDDSTGTWEPEEPTDTSATYTTSGSLRRNQSVAETLNISTDYQVEVDGFCSPTYSEDIQGYRRRKGHFVFFFHKPQGYDYSL